MECVSFPGKYLVAYSNGLLHVHYLLGVLVPSTAPINQILSVSILADIPSLPCITVSWMELEYHPSKFLPVQSTLKMLSFTINISL